MIAVDCILKTAPNLGDEDYALATVSLVVPYYVWTEILTHKRFARNATSNRAMSVEKNIGLGYFVPNEFLSAGKGMSSGDPVDYDTHVKAVDIYRDVWDYCSKKSRELADLGVANEQFSRVLPAFKNMRGIVTGTMDAWKHFFKLRLTSLADSAMQDFASKTMHTIGNCPFEYSKFHYPFRTDDGIADDDIRLAFISAGRIARISYGNRNESDKDLSLGEKLYEDGHMSPFEHSAKWTRYPKQSAINSKAADGYGDRFAWQNFRSELEDEE